MIPKVLILSGYGINCENEMAFAFDQEGAKSDIVHINDIIENPNILKQYQILGFPGGFSYGDHMGAGKGFASRIKNNLYDHFQEFISRDTLTLGICNGFQVMTALGIVPALGGDYTTAQVALMANTSHRYICRWVHLRVDSSKCIFTQGIEKLYVPIAHGEGNFYASKENVKKLSDADQVVFRYVSETGDSADGKEPHNPNGSVDDIAGICDPTGRILGMMPHPERNLFLHNRPDFTSIKDEMVRSGKEFSQRSEGTKIFENAVKYFK